MAARYRSQRTRTMDSSSPASPQMDTVRLVSASSPETPLFSPQYPLSAELNERERLTDDTNTISDDIGHRPYSPLPPPRPFFLAESQNRSSWSSQDSSADAGSFVTTDSDPERVSSANIAQPMAYRARNGWTKASTLPPGAAAPRPGSYGAVGGYPPPSPAPGVNRDVMTSSPEPVGPFTDNAAVEVGAAAVAGGLLGTASPVSPRRPRKGSAPPSAFTLSPGFTVHPYNGPINPDPIPSRRSSVESLRPTSSQLSHGGSSSAAHYTNLAAATGVALGTGAATPRPAVGQAAARPTSGHNNFIQQSPRDGSLDLTPYSARMYNGFGSPAHSRRNSQSDLAAYPISPPFASPHGVPRTPSTLREPFLSPASRATSSVWQPPPPVQSWYTNSASQDAVSGLPHLGHSVAGSAYYNGNGSGMLVAQKKEPLPSSALSRKLSKSDKPWTAKKDKWERWSWWVTFSLMWIGVAVGAIICYRAWIGVPRLPPTCLVFEDDFNSLDTTNTWTRNVSMSGFGNGEFQMTTDSSNNSYTQNGQLYIMPTFTSDIIGTSAIFNGYTYNLDGCTDTGNTTSCEVTSDSSTDTVIPPAQSARLSTQNSFSIQYGKVEVRAKMPQGDWLWPAIWMLPVNSTYGPWPLSGEIDIVEARGNGPSYSAQGDNFVRSSLNWGPASNLLAQVFGWQSEKQSTYADDFHVYLFEWDSDFMRFSVDSRVYAMLNLQFNKQSFWQSGGFPATVQDGANQVDVVNPWAGQPNVAPFNQAFYLILDVAVGGTSGWFPDNVGGKPWHDSSATAMSDFANAQSTWGATWPESADSRAMRVDYVKMYKLC